MTMTKPSEEPKELQLAVKGFIERKRNAEAPKNGEELLKVCRELDLNEAQADAAFAHYGFTRPVEHKSTEVVLQEVDCKRCGGFFDSSVLLLHGAVAAQSRYCPECINAINSEREAEQAASKAAAKEAAFRSRWDAVVPESYREPFDLDRLVKDVATRHARELEKRIIEKPWDEAKFRATVEAILEHPPGKQGVSVIGRTRRGKSRIIFQRLERVAREGHSFDYVNLAVFGTVLSGMMSEDMARANRWIERLCSVRYLFLDDLGKQRNTERVMAEIYRIVETRTTRNLAIDFTANEKGDALIEKMLTNDGQISEHAEPTVERLRESCKGFAL